MSKETLSPESGATLMSMFARPRPFVVLGATRQELEGMGLIEANQPQRGEHVEYEISEKGACLCRAMIRLPLPIEVWQMPSLTRETDEGGPV